MGETIHILFHGKRHTRETGAPEAEVFLTHLAVDGQVAAAIQNQVLSALLFLYREALGIDLPWIDGVVRAKRPEHLPVVLSGGEVQRALDRMQCVDGRFRRCAAARHSGRRDRDGAGLDAPAHT